MIKILKRNTPPNITFLFHTKIFKSYFLIEYYLYNNPLGLYCNYPLSFKDNTFIKAKNKSYYIINYNKASQEVTLYLDILFRSAKKIGKDNNANSDNSNVYYHYDNFGYYLWDMTIS